MKIFTGHLFHETNTFAHGTTDIARFATGGLCEKDEVYSRYRGSSHYIGGAIKAAEEEGAELVFSISVGTAGPLITRECLDFYVNKLCESLMECRDEIDGICLQLHGAGCAEGIDDIEAYTLERVREIAGNDMPLTASLDLHGNITEDMVRLSNGLFGIKEYPHTDIYNAGYLAMKSLIRHIRGEIRLKTSLVRIPLLIPCDKMATASGVGEQMKLLARDVAEKYALIDATFFHGFAHADTPAASASVVTVENGLAGDNALKAAWEIARAAWDHRAEFMPELTDEKEALRRAEKLIEPGRLVIVCEVSDNGGGGGPNDGTFVFRELLKLNRKRTILASICDPEAADLAHKAGVGAKINLAVGAKVGDMHGEPVYLEGAEVLGLSDGFFHYTTPMYFGQPYSVGNTARLKYGNVEFVVCSVPRQTHDDRMIAITGAAVEDYELICLKSINAFKAFYFELPNYKATVMCNPKGVVSSDLSTFKYTRLERAMYPIDKNVKF